MTASNFRKMVGLQEAEWQVDNINNNNETMQLSPLASNPQSKQTRLSDFNVS
jgi:hypothetical protein